jgi:hypothetical protein
MRLSSFRRKCGVFAFVLASTLAAAATASAGPQSGFFTHKQPGIACRPDNPNVSPWYGALVNYSGAATSVSCPLEGFGDGARSSSVSVDLDSGASIGDCTVYVMDPDQGGWFFSPTSLTHNASLGIDTVSFAPPDHIMSFGIGANLRCVLWGNTGVLYSYAERTQQVFDQASW